MIEQDEHFILIPKGAGKFYKVLKNEIFVVKPSISSPQLSLMLVPS